MVSPRSRSCTILISSLLQDLLAPLDVRSYRELDKMHTAPEEVDNGHGVWPSKVNMYQDVLPNPKTRVRLATFNSDPSTDYINANYVRDRSGKFTWIAAQGPMDSTINNFWRMIWEKKIPVVIMLTKTVEGNVKKCAKYLPKLVGRPERRGFFDVTLESFEGYPEGNGKKKLFSVKYKDDTQAEKRHC